VVVVAGIVALLVGVLVDPDDDAASAGQAVRATRSEAMTYVEILSPDRPDDVLADLRSVGVDARSEDRATGPSRVGKVVSIVVEGASGQAAKPPGGMFAAYVEPTAKVIIGVGVATPAGGLYDVPTDAFEAEEPLRCLSWPGQATADLSAVVADTDLDLRVIDDDTGPLETVPPGRVVVAATAVAADRVIVYIAPGPVAAAPPYCETATLSG
jgi:hypothetical protein